MLWQSEKTLKIVALAIFLLLAACGSPESETTTVPEASPVPEPTPSGSTPTPGTSTDTRIPDLTGSVPFSLTDKTNLSGLTDIAGQVFPKLVGDPRIVMHLKSDRNLFTEGDVLFGFEDQKGWWGASLPIVPEVSTYTPTFSKLIFTDPIPPQGWSSDPLLTFLAELTTVTADAESEGTLYYRVRKSGELQCQKVVDPCLIYPMPYCWGMPPLTMDSPARQTECNNYMSKTNTTSVKKLGTFRVKFPTWIILTE